MENKKKLELYIHIPFCEKKCAYCDFLSQTASEDVKREYVKTLTKEIVYQSKYFKNNSVPSLFLGGGTPSVLTGEQIKTILAVVKEHFLLSPDAEISIECNPGTISPDKLMHYRQAGINRISLGLQSARNEELELLGRIHTREQFLESYKLLEQAGFKNINVDLMQALPGQTLEQWKYSLAQVVRLKPSHISAYSLMIEEGTPFYDQYQEDEQCRERGDTPRQLPDEETERAMYEWTGQYLKDYGYEHYEISNYAQKGLKCHHNLGYWSRENYLGLGLGSSSLVDNHRFANVSKLSEYLKGEFKKCGFHQLEIKEQMEEFMFLGLRCMAGISTAAFQSYFGTDLDTVYGAQLTELSGQGLLLRQAGSIKLTEAGITVSNYVLSQFLK